MSDLVRYGDGGVARPEREVDWAWQSPSTYWTITRVQPTHQTGRRSFESYAMLLIEFTHFKENGDRIIMEAYVSRREELAQLKSFLDASVEIPEGIRIRTHTVKKAPWDDQTPRYRPR